MLRATHVLVRMPCADAGQACTGCCSFPVHAHADDALQGALPGGGVRQAGPARLRVAAAAHAAQHRARPLLRLAARGRVRLHGGPSSACALMPARQRY